MTTIENDLRFHDGDPTNPMGGAGMALVALGDLSTHGALDGMTGVADASVGEFDLADEKYRLGTVVDVRLAKPEAYGFTADTAPASIVEVTLSDPYIEKYSPETQAEVGATELAINDFARTRREQGLWVRQPMQAYTGPDGKEGAKKVWGDPVTTHLFFDEMLGSEALQPWRKLIPSAMALSYLSDPVNATTVYSKKTRSEVPVDEEARKWWTLCTDAVAIRSRATVMAELVNGYVDKHVERGGDPDELRWMSIACGTALPTLKAAARSDIAPKVTLIDYDENAMSETESLAEQVNFEGDIEKITMDIFNAEEMSALKDKLEAKGELPQLVDMMGILEYTGKNLGVDSVQFLRSGYDLVAPGGTLIFGQMRDDRPVSDFTMGVVGWPWVEQRSPKEVMDIIIAADIPQERVRMYMPADSVYMVVAIDKPDELPQLPSQRSNSLA